MNLLIVTQYFWPENFRINELAATLVERGVSTTVLTGKPNYPEGRILPGYRAGGCAEEVYKGARVLRVPLFPRGKGSGLRLALNYVSFILSAIVWGPWLLRKTKPDAIFVYCPSPLLQALPALLIGWMKRAPVIVYVQDLWPESLVATGYVRNRLILEVVRRAVRYIYRRADLIMVSSRPFSDAVARLAPGSRIAYFPNSVDDSFCDPDAGPKVFLPILDHPFPVVFAGNVGSAQAMDVVVEAAALLAAHGDIKLVILGSGSQLEWVRQQVQKRGMENVHLAGRFPSDAMPYLLSKAAVLLVTLADQPIFAATVPNKIQAYMAVGRPIVACLNGEAARLVEEAAAGLAVPAGDAEGLAQAILRIHRMPLEDRARLGANGRAYYLKNFNHESLVSDLIDHLQELIGEKA